MSVFACLHYCTKTKRLALTGRYPAYAVGAIEIVDLLKVSLNHVRIHKTLKKIG